jgi:phage major head subunit gpT-like protein
MAVHIARPRLNALRVQFEAKFQEAFQNVGTWNETLATGIPSEAESNLYGFIENEVEIREWVGERELQVLEEQDYRLANKHWESSVRLNRDRIADDTLGMFVDVALPMFATRVAKFHDRRLIDFLLNNATAYDSVDFFSVAGRSYANSGTATLAVDGAAFSATRAAMLSFVDLKGEPRYIGEKFTLVVPPQLERIARLVVEAEWNSHTSTQMGTNVQKGFAEVLVVPELAANPNRWFLAATGLPLKPFIVQNRSMPQMIALDDPNMGGPPFLSNENVYGVDFRSAYGVSFPWLMYANDPDAAMGA